MADPVNQIHGDGLEDWEELEYDHYDQTSCSDGYRIFEARDRIEAMMGKYHESLPGVWEELRQLRDYLCEGML
jgi:hypothetical protein